MTCTVVVVVVHHDLRSDTRDTHVLLLLVMLHHHWLLTGYKLLLMLLQQLWMKMWLVFVHLRLLLSWVHGRRIHIITIITARCLCALFRQIHAIQSPCQITRITRSCGGIIVHLLMILMLEVLRLLLHHARILLRITAVVLHRLWWLRRRPSLRCRLLSLRREGSLEKRFSQPCQLPHGIRNLIHRGSRPIGARLVGRASFL
mmetsp:Transcript_370/g.914  ORF Transcript_370/g.914 Transcript_370/m.914 type:complete len:202 (-) Transcript_370:863-1468(-)